MKRTAIALALTLAAGTAAAQEAGFYLGASVGQSKVSNGGCEGASGGITCEDTDTAFKVFGGYQFNRNIALELGYSDRLAKLSASGFGTSAEVTVSAFEIVAVPSLPLSENFSLYGKVGVYAASTEARSSFGATADDSNTGGTIGLGVAYHFNKNITARADWQRYAKVGGDNVGEADIDTLNIGLLFRF
jgi:OOP family OmpA-OmpF porin